MASNLLVKVSTIRYLEQKLFNLSICSVTQTRQRHRVNTPRLRNPTWFTQKNRVIHEDFLTPENREFVKEVIGDKYASQTKVDGEIHKQIASNVEWNPTLRRTGVIARKIGIYPMWLNTGAKISTTLLQVLDNHVIKYYTPDEYEPARKRNTLIVKKKACLLIGAECTDPSLLTKEYCGIFRESGVVPKKYLARFYVSPDAMLPPGTPINVMHFQVGNVVDVRGKTVDRGFQGVMKRHGFKGMPASHGVTKTHRRGGNIGGGGEKARVWPGTKMPGHMGNRYRIQRGLKILRINTKHNVIWVTGQAIAGETNSIVTIYDTILPLKRPSSPVPFPTFLSTQGTDFPENSYDSDIHPFSEPTIQFNE